MSVHKNIPQHLAPQRTKVTALYDSVRESYMNLPAPMKLDREWWPASRPVPSDGRSTKRVRQQMFEARRRARDLAMGSPFPF